MAISRVSGNAAAADTVAMPTHQAGDLLLLLAYRGGTTSLPGSVAGWTSLDADSSGQNAWRIVYKFAASSGETTGTWSNASAVMVVVYRADGTWQTPTLSVNGNAFAASTMTWNDLNAPTGVDTLWYVRLAGHRTATNMQANTPTGWTSTTGMASLVRAMDTNGSVVGVHSQNIGGNSQSTNSSSSWRTATVALSEVLPPSSGTMSASLASATVNASGAQAQSGSFTAALRSAVVAMTGQQVMTGSLASVLRTALFSGLGGQQYQGGITTTLRQPQAAFAGNITLQGGALVAVITTAKATMTGQQRQTGSLAVALTRPSIALAGGSILTQGSVGVTLTRALFSGQGSQRITGTMAAQLQVLSATLAGESPPRGVMATAMQPVSFFARFGLRIPSSATVFTLRGLNAQGASNPDIMEQHFLGIFNQPPYNLVKLKYPASFASNSINEGVKALDAALMSTSGQIIVIGQSQGAQVCSRWMRLYANDPTRAALAGRITFILTGNPLHSLGGYIWKNGKTEIGGGLGQPQLLSTPWPVIQVARRWEGWCDWPDDDDNDVAIRNAKSGQERLHKKYREVDLFSPAHTIWQSGNSTFVLTHEDELPMYANAIFLSPQFKSVVKREVEDGYNRPPGDPPVTVTPTQSRFWANVLQVMGIANS
ncbi:hypothetical protein EB72_24870 [Mycobacterium sp. SWH-M1]|nr:hypothetical protein EB72_24870 [Mycobacterium sp. SWH-M1]